MNSLASSNKGLVQQPQLEKLLLAITSAQRRLLGILQTEELFNGLLGDLLELTESEYGFIGEILYTDAGAPYLRTHAITNIAWNEETRAFYDRSAPDGLEFFNLSTLFGEVITSGNPVIANHPSQDPRRGGLPEGHPALDTFMGIPLHTENEFVGMAGIANRASGYSEQLLSTLEPFVQTCAYSVFALRADRERTRVQKELDIERRRLAAVADGTFDGIITIGQDGNVQSSNRRAHEMFGYKSGAMLGRPVTTLLPDAHGEIVGPIFKEKFEQLRMAAMSNRIVARELVGKRSDQTLFPVKVTVNQLEFDGLTLFNCLVQDLSELEAADRRLAELQNEMERNRLGPMIGKSSSMKQLYEKIGDIAKGDWNLLIEGETGSGKELVARAIHASSDRRNGPFVAINLAGLTGTLLSSQFFGHKRGAFTGALKDQIGFFEAAVGGTLFLDEVGEASPEIQAALLRVVEQREVIPLGTTKSVPVDVRIITATNRDLTREVEKGHFRQDLFYRLRVARLVVPPLRERRVDLELLAESFLAEIRVVSRKPIAMISPAAMKCLKSFDWPGNVRELKGALEFAAIHSSGGTIHVADLPMEIQRAGSEVVSSDSKVPKVDSNDVLLQALAEAEGNRSKAAQLLGISRATLYRRLKALD